MNSFIESIFKKIANKLGLELQRKSLHDLDYFETEDISLTAAIAGRIATLTLMDSKINVAGDNLRAKALNETVDDLEKTDQLKGSVEVALGTGDCLIKPYTDGKSIGFNLVPSGDFIITEYIGKKIKGCLIKCDEIETDHSIYERVEYHHLVTREGVPTLVIEQMAFRDGKSIEISKVPQWADLEDMEIPNVNQMVFGRIKCPMINRGDLNSPNGVPITYGMDKPIDNALAAYDRFNQEYEDKETIIFADKTMLEPKRGEAMDLPAKRRKLFMKIRGGSVDDTPVKWYSEPIRDASLIAGIEQNFKMLELLAGLSAGILTAPSTNFATATEMRATLQLSFAFIQRVRKGIEDAIDDVTEGAWYIMNMNDITPIGDYEVLYDWSDEYIQEIMSRFNMLIASNSIGAASKAEVRSYVMKEPLDLAQEKVAEMDEAEGGLEDEAR